MHRGGRHSLVVRTGLLVGYARMVHLSALG
jgi:hypothetical protein